MGAALGLKQYSSWIHCFRDILATEGIGGFYKVLVPCCFFPSFLTFASQNEGGVGGDGQLGASLCWMLLVGYVESKIRDDKLQHDLGLLNPRNLVHLPYSHIFSIEFFNLTGRRLSLLVGSPYPIPCNN